MRKTKRTLAILLALLTTLTTAACGKTADFADTANGEAIAASASAEASAKWLSDRLGSAADGITVGTAADAERYGVDLDGLRSDGYVIRKENGKALIFGVTEDGLDRGVRYFANHFADVDSANYTYGDGYRVKSLTIAGNDISEYVILSSADADECHTYAASELQKYIKNACGAELQIVTERPAAGHVIRLEQIAKSDARYAALGDEGFTIAVKNGDLTITGGVYRGCLYGVYEFLESYVGYRFLYNYDKYDRADLTAGYIDYLYESDHVDVPEGTSDTQVPSFALRDQYHDIWNIADYSAKVKGLSSYHAVPKYNGYGVTWVGSHGTTYFLQAIGEYEGQGTQPCFTDDELIEKAKDYYISSIASQLATGKEIGREITDIDVGQLDTGNFCMCANCMKLIQLDGGHVGPVLNYANTIADAVNEVFHDENGDPVIYVKFLAYHGTNSVPRVTRPRDNVVPSYCFIDGLTDTSACYAHPLDGSKCVGPQRENITMYVPSNAPYARELAGWCEISKRVTVWYYPGMWQWQALPAPLTLNLREDMAYLNSFDNLYGLFIDPGMYYQTEERVAMYMLYRLMWNADMTEEEYQNYIKEYYYIMCGDGGEYVYDYVRGLEDTAKTDYCWSTMAWTDPSERIDFDRVAENFEYNIMLYEKALALAGTADQENFVRNMSRTMYFPGLVATHTDWYENGTDVLRARYTQIYNDFKELAISTGFFVSDRTNPLTETNFNIEENLATLFDFNQSPGGSAEWWK